MYNDSGSDQHNPAALQPKIIFEAPRISEPIGFLVMGIHRAEAVVHEAGVRPIKPVFDPRLQVMSSLISAAQGSCPLFMCENNLVA